jgi:hypothetical protein
MEIDLRVTFLNIPKILSEKDTHTQNVVIYVKKHLLRSVLFSDDQIFHCYHFALEQSPHYVLCT